MYHARFDDTRDYCPDMGDAESVVDMELKSSVGIVAAVVREDVEERADQIEVLARHVRHLEDGADPLAHKLSSRVDALFVVLDEDGYLPRPRALQDPRYLRDGLLQNLRRANVDFRDDHHDWHVQGKCNAQVLFAHADEAVVGRNHKQAIIWAARQKPKHRGTQVTFMARQVGERDDFCAALPDLLP